MSVSQNHNISNRLRYLNTDSDGQAKNLYINKSAS